MLAVLTCYKMKFLEFLHASKQQYQRASKITHLLTLGTLTTFKSTLVRGLNLASTSD